MTKKISRLELCGESLKRIIFNLIEINPFRGGKCSYCGGINTHQDSCIYETAGLVTRNVRPNKKPDSTGGKNGPL